MIMSRLRNRLAKMEKKSEQEINVGNTIEYNNELFGKDILKFKVEKIKIISELDSEEIKLLNKYHPKKNYKNDNKVYIGILDDDKNNSFEYIGQRYIDI